MLTAAAEYSKSQLTYETRLEDLFPFSKMSIRNTICEEQIHIKTGLNISTNLSANGKFIFFLFPQQTICKHFFEVERSISTYLEITRTSFLCEILFQKYIIYELQVQFLYYLSKMIQQLTKRK